MVPVISQDATMECVEIEGDDVIASSQIAQSNIACSIPRQNMYKRTNMKIYELLIWKQGQCKTSLKRCALYRGITKEAFLCLEMEDFKIL